MSPPTWPSRRRSSSSSDRRLRMGRIKTMCAFEDFHPECMGLSVSELIAGRADAAAGRSC